MRSSWHGLSQPIGACAVGCACLWLMRIKPAVPVAQAHSAAVFVFVEPAKADPALSVGVPAIAFNDMTVTAACGWLSSKSGVPIEGQWATKVNEHKIGDLPVTIDRPAGTLEMALDALAESTSDGSAIAWQWDGGKVRIVPLMADATVRVYDVAGLMQTGKAAAYLGRHPIPQPLPHAIVLPARNQVTPLSSHDSLIHLVERIDPASWEAGGGNMSNPEILNDMLVVTARGRTQWKIGALLFDIQGDK